MRELDCLLQNTPTDTRKIQNPFEINENGNKMCFKNAEVDKDS